MAKLDGSPSAKDKAFYTGKIDNPNLNAPVQTTTDASGNTLVASFPNDIDEFPVPVTKELIDRQRGAYLQALRALDDVAAQASGDVTAALLVEGAALHLEADLKWLDLCEQRIEG